MLKNKDQIQKSWRKLKELAFGLRANVTIQHNALKKIVATTWKLRNGLSRDVTSHSNALPVRRRFHSTSLIFGEYNWLITIYS